MKARCSCWGGRGTEIVVGCRSNVQQAMGCGPGRDVVVAVLVAGGFVVY